MWFHQPKMSIIPFLLAAGPEPEENTMITKKALTFFSASAPAGIELLNLWNDFRKVVKFIDENPWVKPMLEKIMRDKNH